MAEQKIAPEFSVFEMELDQPFFVLSETEPFTKITGELKFELTKPLPKTEKLVFRFLGGVVARHDETRNNSKLRGLRRLFDKELILWEPNVDHPEMDPTDEQDPRSPAIVGRTRTLCFSVKVPSTTPPTSSWKRGHIQYLLVASFFHEPACISCCGGIRIPLLGYRDPDVIKKEIIIRRASPGLLTSLPAYSELAPAKAEGEAEKPAEQNEEEERKVAERLFRKHRENVLRWRPLKDMEIVIPAVIHNNEEKVHVLVESGKSPKIINTSEEGVDSIGDEVELQCFSWCLKQIEKYELT
ncbi:hypothetical protein BJ742DRAFT_394449 [Cladochytrium replicatum]|nr:hypothetical protein BJ742DRAFT_394449 [Cladochytrium replicatum]